MPRPRPPTQAIDPSTIADDALTIPPEDEPSEEESRSDGYVIGGELGRGGIAQVLRAYDPALGREVAMKTLDDRYRDATGIRAALLSEARLTGRLEHPNIVPVHALGAESDGTPYFTMRLVRGETFRKWMSGHPGPTATERLADALEVFLKVCDAVAFAHDNGILHRDIKPDNVMVGRFGEVYLMDWGLATRSPAAATSQAIGTPGFIPPEQANGEQADERADVFALGALLYFMVAGKAPYSGGPSADILRRARACAWTDLAESPALTFRPLGLFPIIRTAMARAPADRYSSALALSEAVRGYLRSGMHLPRRTYAPGALILQEGEVAEEAFILVSGRARAWRDVNGARVTLREMNPGDVFGELAILSDRPRSATVEAIDAVTVHVVRRDALHDGLGMQSFLGNFVRALAGRFSALEDQVLKSKK